jgi:hypothetical protein
LPAPLDTRYGVAILTVPVLTFRLVYIDPDSEHESIVDSTVTSDEFCSDSPTPNLTPGPAWTAEMNLARIRRKMPMATYPSADILIYRYSYR